MVILGIAAVIGVVTLAWAVWPLPGHDDETTLSELRFRWWYLRWTFRADFESWRDLGYSRLRAGMRSLRGAISEIGVSGEVYDVWKTRP